MRRYRLRDPKYTPPDAAHQLVAVDLGKRKVGVAVFDVAVDGKATLTKACTVKCDDGPEAMALAIFAAAPDKAYWVAEWPMKYKDKRLYHEAIEDLQAVGDALERLILGWDEKYRPGEWKGNVPKPAHHRRIRKALTENELAIMPELTEHDAWDAAGIGLFATVRTKRGGGQLSLPL